MEDDEEEVPEDEEAGEREGEEDGSEEWRKESDERLSCPPLSSSSLALLSYPVVFQVSLPRQ